VSGFIFYIRKINIVFITGQQEVIEGLPEQEQPRSNIDRLIEALAQRQIMNEEEYNNIQQNEDHQQVRQIASPRGSRPGLRRVGDVEGVRQSSGNWQRDNTTPWNKPMLARPLNPAILDTQYKQT
jgi:bromodomain and WD repeat domain-containing protein 1/3